MSDGPGLAGQAGRSTPGAPAPKEAVPTKPDPAGQVEMSEPTGRARAFLEVRHLGVHFRTDGGLVRAVDGLSFQLERGRTLGIVGESGSGKSALSLAIMGLNRGRGTLLAGEIWLDGENLAAAPADRLRRLRGKRMAMIFQDPLSAMHPHFTVGAQIAEAHRLHHAVSRKAARTYVVELLGALGIPAPAKRVDDYPHQLSGGMRQRALIAMALASRPELLIADEPTTALDVTVQAQILELLRDLQREAGTTLVVITHDLGVVTELADDVLVMYAGRAVEHGPAAEVLTRPEHPYTWGLLQSAIRLDRPRKQRLPAIAGAPPNLVSMPRGCSFHLRCPYMAAGGPVCRDARPESIEASPGHWVACHLPATVRRLAYAEKVVPTL